jgi:hypothetical protein
MYRSDNDMSEGAANTLPKPKRQFNQQTINYLRGRATNDVSGKPEIQGHQREERSVSQNLLQQTDQQRQYSQASRSTTHIHKDSPEQVRNRGIQNDQMVETIPNAETRPSGIVQQILAKHTQSARAATMQGPSKPSNEYDGVDGRSKSFTQGQTNQIKQEYGYQHGVEEKSTSGEKRCKQGHLPGHSHFEGDECHAPDSVLKSEIQPATLSKDLRQIEVEKLERARLTMLKRSNSFSGEMHSQTEKEERKANRDGYHSQGEQRHDQLREAEMKKHEQKKNKQKQICGFVLL